MSEIYFKSTLDLNKKELLHIYDALPGRQYPTAHPTTDKASVVLNILDYDRDFLKQIRNYCFEETDEGILKYLVDHKEPCIQKFAQERHRINPNKIYALVSAKDLSEILASDPFDEDDEEDTLNQTVQPGNQFFLKAEGQTQTDLRPKGTAQQPKQTVTSAQNNLKSFDKSSSSSDYKVKAPKYQQSVPIKTWLRNMEIFATCSNIAEDKLITIAISHLLSGDAGANIIESLDETEMANWNLFKKKLRSIMGHSREFYKDEFHKYQRGSDSFGL